METVNIHEAKTQLSKLVDRAADGEAFVIAKAGKPLVKVTALDTPRQPRRLGFLDGEIAVPDDFNRMGEREIAVLFGADADTDTGQSRQLPQRRRTQQPQHTQQTQRTR